MFFSWVWKRNIPKTIFLEGKWWIHYLLRNHHLFLEQKRKFLGRIFYLLRMLFFVKEPKTNEEFFRVTFCLWPPLILWYGQTPSASYHRHNQIQPVSGFWKKKGCTLRTQENAKIEHCILNVKLMQFRRKNQNFIVIFTKMIAECKVVVFTMIAFYKYLLA